MPYRIDITDPSPGVLDHLIELGALDVESVDGRLAAILPDSVPQGLLQGEVSAAVARDDGSVWLLQPRPIRIGDTVLHLKDSDAFGSGYHPTTALCIEAIEPVERMLDIGTGSGVLALAGLIKGVKQAVGVDTDPQALKAAAANAKLNHLQSRLQLVIGGPDAVTGTWPLVVANILAAPLMHMAPLIARRLSSHGRLILSGITDTMEMEVRRAYRHVGIEHVDTTSRNGWVAIDFRTSW